MQIDNLFLEHIKLVELVNNSKTESEHRSRELQLNGFRHALDVIGVNQLIRCDQYYLEQGIDRPMCCGVFLDWKPEQLNHGH